MNLTNIKARRKDSGFTIVELLVVIVVIGILAAITIISYAGITARANTSAAQSAANALIQKAEAYNAINNAYPATFGALINAPTSEVYNLTGVTMLTAAPTLSAPNNGITYYVCTGGIQAGYWNYSDGVINYIQSGATTSGTKTVSATGCAAKAT